MRILHIGFGFRPFRNGGLIEYAEDLMAAQVANGDTVGYFNAGRRYPWFRKPRLWRWRRGGVHVFEVINSPMVLDEYGSKDPLLDVSEPHTERLLRNVIKRFRPEIIHVQELSSLPLSVLQIVRESAVPSLMTLHDYLPLCPTLRLYDYLGQVCLQRDIGHKCVPCCTALSGTSAVIIQGTWRYEFKRILGPRLTKFLRQHKDSLRPVQHAFHRATTPRASAPTKPTVENSTTADSAAADAFQSRRDTAVARLNALDLVVAPSRRVKEIYQTLGVTSGRLRTVNISVDHLGRIKFRPLVHVPTPVTFITLNGCGSIAKGATLMRDAFVKLAAELPPNSFRLIVCGWIHPAAQELSSLPQTEHRGSYHPRELDQLLEQAHVGIMPSIWEEAYGFTGIEMLAKGLPLIGNAMGGITDYLKPGVTGWLNTTNSAEGLAAIVREVIAQPEQILALNESIGRQRASIIKPMEVHLGEIEQLYGEAARVRNASSLRVA
jgi:glycosyltransferase involved in cell wall biosynthesis